MWYLIGSVVCFFAIVVVGIVVSMCKAAALVESENEFSNKE